MAATKAKAKKPVSSKTAAKKGAKPVPASEKPRKTKGVPEEAESQEEDAVHVDGDVEVTEPTADELEFDPEELVHLSSADDAVGLRVSDDLDDLDADIEEDPYEVEIGASEIDGGMDFDVVEGAEFSVGYEPDLELDVDRVAAKVKREERSERIKGLIKKAEAQGGYLTYDDINEALPTAVIKDTDIESYLAILRGMEIEIIDASEVERFRIEHEQEEQRGRGSRMDFFDDPIRMYLHQMGDRKSVV